MELTTQSAWMVPDSGVKGLREFVVRMGAEIYRELGLTGLNTMPVDDHCAFALLDCTVSDKPALDPKQCGIRVLSQGSVALIRNEHILGENGEHAGALEARGIDPEPQNFSFIEGLVLDNLRWDLSEAQRSAFPEFSRRTFAQRFHVKIGQEVECITRIYMRTPDGWLLQDFRYWGEARQQMYARSTVPLDGIVVEPYGLGILYQPQEMLHDMENIRRSIRQLQSGVNSKTIITGLQGNMDQASFELNRRDKNVAALNSGASVYRVASTAQIDQLKTEFDLILGLYLRAVHIMTMEQKTHITEWTSRLNVAPMLVFVQDVQNQIARVLNACGVTITFQKINVEAMAERVAKYGLLKLKRDDAVLEQQEFKQLAAAA